MSLKNFVIKELKAEEIIFSEGDPAGDMYIILSGVIRILKQEGHTLRHLTNLDKGAIFGEMSVLDNEPRSATAIANSDTKVVCITQDNLQTTLDRLPGWANSLVRVITQRLRNATTNRYHQTLRNAFPSLLYILTCKRMEWTVEHVQYSTHYLAGLNHDDIRKLLEALAKIGIIQIDSDENILVHDTHVVELYYEYLYKKSKGEKVREENIHIQELNTIHFLDSLKNKIGDMIQDKIQIQLSHLNHEIDNDDNTNRVTISQSIDKLYTTGWLQTHTNTTKTRFSSHKQTKISWEIGDFERVIKFHKWVHIFAQDVIDLCEM